MYCRAGAGPIEGVLTMKRFAALITALLICLLLGGCKCEENVVVIYTSAEDYRVEHMRQRLWEEFPEYEILIEYLPTGNHAARLLAEGTESECDITYDLEYSYLEKLEEQGILADLSGFDYSIYREDAVESTYYIPGYRNGGAIILNRAVLDKYGLEAPECYDDLLKPEYRGLISMPNPASSGTGYMFLLAMVNERGEEATVEYFDSLAENVLQFTSSGSGPVNALIQGEVAIGLGITGTAVNAINDGADLEIVFFEEGSPYALYGLGMVAGKEERTAVQEVFSFLHSEYGYENCANFYPEPIYADMTFDIRNYPSEIIYCNMSGDTAQYKEALLAKWNY